MTESLSNRRGSLARILVIDEEIPWPANTGKRLRTLNLLTCVAHEFQIDLLVHGGAATAEAVEEMRRRGITVHAAPSRIPSKTSVLTPFRIAASIAARLPYSVYSHQQAAFRRELRRLLRADQFDLVHCEWTPYAVYTAELRMPVCVAAHNIEFAIWRRLASADTRMLYRGLFALQAALMERFERQVFARSQFATAVSEDDATSIRSMGAREVVVVPNGVDAGAFAPMDVTPQVPRSLVFTGSMDWRPNQDAIRWFIDAVHPLLLEQGDYQLHVVGRSPPSWMHDRAVVPPQVVVTGTVADVRPFIANASVYVVPLRAGGGSRLKILEALAMGRAVVSTTVGAEGLDVEAGKEILLEDTPAGFAAAIARLWDDPSRRVMLGRSGRALIETQYRWEQIAPLQGALWRRAISEAAGRRVPSTDRIDQR
jgi:glycosyltransferase involved in cell wall biosynthesis